MQNFLTNVLPTVFGTGFLIIFYIIQIAKSVKTKTAKGISWIGWTMLNLALLSMFTASVAVFHYFHTYGMLVTESANLVLALIELFLILKYRQYDKIRDEMNAQTPVKQSIGFSINVSGNATSGNSQ
jgi:uncharacterized protein with PQ loop repeat